MTPNDSNAASTARDVAIDDEQLVAYLDRELSPQDSRRVEDQLIAEPSLRERLAHLQSGWEMLSVLEHPVSQRDLVASTMEMVALDLTSSMPAISVPTTDAAIDAASVTSAATPKPRGRRGTIRSGGDNAATRWLPSMVRSRPWSWMVIAVVAAVMVAWGLAVWRTAVERERAFGRIFIAQHFDAFRQHPDLEFVRYLASREDWQQFVASVPRSEAAALQQTTLNFDGWKAFDASTDHWTDADRGLLASRLETLRGLPPSQANRMHRTAEQVAAASDADRLITHMHAMARWRESLPGDMQQRLDELSSRDSSADRPTVDEFLTSAIAGSMQKVAGRSVAWLDAEATDRIAAVLRQIVQSRLEAGDPEVTRVYRASRFFSRRADPMTATLLRLFVPSESWMGRWRLSDARKSDRLNVDQRGGNSSGGPTGGSSGNSGDESSFMIEMTSDEYELIIASLPDQAYDQLQRLAVGDSLTTQTVLDIWAEEAVERLLVDDNDQSVKERYLELPESQQRRLNLLSPEDFYQQLASPTDGGRR